jgi:hypothetical protein
MPLPIPLAPRHSGSEDQCESVLNHRAGKQTFAIRGHVVDVVNDAEEDDEASE